MNIHLTPELEEFVKQKVASGLYHSASEVICDALTLMEEIDRIREVRLEALRKEIQKGLDQVERGEDTVYDEHTLKDLFERIRVEGMRRLQASQQTGH